jgi:hypothetical protein
MNPDRFTPRNVSSSGALVSPNSENGTAIFSGYDLRAGGIRSGRVTIVNPGTSAGRLRLSEAAASNTFAEGDLTLLIDNVTGKRPVLVYRGDIGEMPAEGIDLGNLKPSETRTFRFIVTLASDSPNGGQGRGAGAAYSWDLELEP